MLNVQLLLIDPQNDFCEKGPDDVCPECGSKLYERYGHPKQAREAHMPFKGSLYVPGADESMDRVAAMIDRLGRKLTDIHVTLDSHHRFSIFHPGFLLDKNGKHPDPFTVVTHKDIVDGVYKATIQSLQKWLLQYTKTLEEKGRYDYRIWPYHCLIGTPGANIYPSVSAALDRWEQFPGIVDKIVKGIDWRTEHYSAVRAEVETPDPCTGLNSDLVETTEKADLIPVAGQASNYCVANTLRDMIAEFGKDSVKKFVILTDGMDPVPGDDSHDVFMKEMKDLDVQFSTTTEFLA